MSAVSWIICVICDTVHRDEHRRVIFWMQTIILLLGRVGAVETAFH
jgi:hypothetical protein